MRLAKMFSIKKSFQNSGRKYKTSSRCTRRIKSLKNTYDNFRTSQGVRPLRWNEHYQAYLNDLENIGGHPRHRWFCRSSCFTVFIQVLPSSSFCGYHFLSNITHTNMKCSGLRNLVVGGMVTQYLHKDFIINRKYGFLQNGQLL